MYVVLYSKQISTNQKPEPMKTTATLILFMLLTTIVFAQVEKGNLFFQGSSNIGFNSEKLTTTSGNSSVESYKETSFNFSPKVGYFIIDNLPVGLAIDLRTYNTKYPDVSDYIDKSMSVAFGPFVRYYILKLENLYPFVEIGAGFGSSKYTETYNSSSTITKYGIFKYNLDIGASYFITDHIAFDLLLGYKSIKYKDKDPQQDARRASVEEVSEKYSGMGANIGITVTIPN